MAMGKRRRRARQTSMWVPASDLPRSAGHPFYERLNQVLDEAGFDAFVEGQCANAAQVRQQVDDLARTHTLVSRTKRSNHVESGFQGATKHLSLRCFPHSALSRCQVGGFTAAQHLHPDQAVTSTRPRPSIGFGNQGSPHAHGRSSYRSNSSNSGPASEIPSKQRRSMRSKERDVPSSSWCCCAPASRWMDRRSIRRMCHSSPPPP